MKAKIIKVTNNVSKYGGVFYYVFFIDEKGNHYKTCIHSKCKNSRLWFKHIDTTTCDLWLDNLIVKKGDLIDADSQFVVMRNFGLDAEQQKLFDTENLI